MKALWTYAKVFTPEQCNLIVQTVKEEKPVWATTGSPADGIPNSLDKTFEHRRSKVFWIDKTHPKLGYLVSTMWNIVTPINNEFFGTHLLDLPPLQFTQYSEKYQGEYKLHTDSNWLDQNDYSTKPNFQRKISCVLQLSDPGDYEGGTFEFGKEVLEKPSEEGIKEQGTLIVFPSFIHHGVRPVTKGIRYSLVGWFEGPRWC